MAVLQHLESLSDSGFLNLYETLSERGFGPLDGEVAKALKFRPQAIRKLPLAKRAHQARRLLLREANAEMAYELFGTYLMRSKKDLITRFLDATGVPHEDGMLEDIGNEPDAAKLEGAVTELDGDFPPEDVTLYLVMCAEQWPGSKELESLLAKRTS